MSCKARSHLIAATFAVVTAMIAGSFPLSAGGGVELTIDEEGTEAAAATAVTTTRSAETEFIQFSADRPFMFALRDQNGLIVLAGYVASPQTLASQTSEVPAGTQ